MLVVSRDNSAILLEAGLPRPGSAVNVASAPGK